ncbi:cdkn1a interacting zinc finger protein 1a [Myripristis murdjan]|uniref:Cdkn1a interacting zinc finger protein 1a n=1 Tax=Myripristis murdjan TaxID=586833 RepID=A0A667YZV9_9TELE|nr:cip1-interacting zinc finger protein-like [Myripristis murdjan]
MFNPNIHQQQQQFHQHLRQLQQLFQQQQPPPPPPPQPPPAHHVAHHHHQAQRTIPVPPQGAPPPRMVNLCQATQTTIIAPNPMLQGAILMQQMQGNMRSFAMGGQQFRQFFAAGARSSLLGPVPMGVAIKSPMMGFPAPRHFHPPTRYYNNTTTATATSSTTTTSTDFAARQPDRKRDNEQRASGSADGQQSAISTSDTNSKADTDGAEGGADRSTQPAEEPADEPAAKKQRTEGLEEPKEQSVIEAVTITEADVAIPPEYNSNTEDGQSDECIILEEGGSTAGSEAVEALEESRAAEVHSDMSTPSPCGQQSEESQPSTLAPDAATEGKDAPLASPDNLEEGREGANKFYCYLCSITCHNQQNFRSHMNGISHQQRMMEIQHMSNACLVTLLPRVQESLQAAQKDGEKRPGPQRWCATCQTHFTSNITDHRRTEEHKLASRTASPSCTVCKKHFRTSQLFVEHMQSPEHKQRVEELQEKEGSDLLVADTDGCLVDEQEEEGGEVEEQEERQSSDGDQGSSHSQDGWSALTEVTLQDMASDEQYDPNTVYGSNFLVPVAGFLCRLCNRFCHFESSALHSHCKSLKHFENLKKYRALHSQSDEARESFLRPENTTDCLDGNSKHNGSNTVSVDKGSVTKSMQPIVNITRLKLLSDSQQEEKQPAPTSPPQHLTDNSPSTSCIDQDLTTHTLEEETTSQDSAAKESPAELLASKVEEQVAAVEDTEEEKEKETPAVAGKKASIVKAKPVAKRRSGRTTCRR